MMGKSIKKVLSCCLPEIENHNLEDLHNCDQSWFDHRQFIVLVSEVSFKIKVVNFLKEKNAHFFSLVHQYNSISPTTEIGQGSYIGGFNSMEVDGVEISDHVIIGTHNTFGHQCCIGDYCHLSHHSFFNFCTLRQGTVVGSYVMIVPPSAQLSSNIDVKEYSNILSQSVLTKSLAESGTFYNKRRVSADSSVDHRIL